MHWMGKKEKLATGKEKVSKEDSHLFGFEVLHTTGDLIGE